MDISPDFTFTYSEQHEAQKYLDRLAALNINYTYPGDANYPKKFYHMTEPPLFLEYVGRPFWMEYDCIAVVGTRKMHELSRTWMRTHFSQYLQSETVCVVSGGAYGVDQMAHLSALKEGLPTVVVVPSGLVDMYPKQLKQTVSSNLTCFVSEFEIDQPLLKSHFYFRNRLIAALGELTFMVQAEIKSGSLLTVHHALQSGRPVVTIPAHPSLIGFAGNNKLIHDGAEKVLSGLDLLELWRAELISSKLLIV